MRNTPVISRRSRYRGASLVEVLVAILLVALGILAMGAMQINATRIAKTSEARAIGALLVADLADRMRANRDGVFFQTNPGLPPVNKYQFTEDYPADGVPELDAPEDCIGPEATACGPDAMAAHDLAAWRVAVAHALPGGWAQVSNVDPTDQGVEIWLMWLDPDNAASAGEAATCPGGAADVDPQPRCMYFRVNL